MKRVLSLVLCLLMVFSTVTLFSSCAKDGEIQVSRSVVDVDIKEYAIVRPNGMSSTTQSKVLDLAAALKAQTGVSYKPVTDSQESVVKNKDPEILIGNVNREETQKVLEDIDGHGFAIRVFKSKNKIVIVGTTNLLTGMAVDYFIEHYATADAIEDTTISVNKKVTLNNIATVTLGADGATDYSVIYKSGLDDKSSCEHGTDCTEPRLDYPVTIANSVVSTLRKAIGARSSALKAQSDAVAEKDTEIVIGNAGRASGLALLSSLTANQYGVLVQDGKVYIQAWNDTALAGASTLFNHLITDSVVETEDEEGNSSKSVVIPASYSVTNTLKSDWVTEFPKPDSDNVELSGMVDVADGSLQYYYTGSGVNAGAFEDYCDLLEENGYTVAVAKNEVEDSIFCTYVNTNTGITLHVSYNAYAHDNETQHGFVKSLRVVAAYTSEVNLPDRDMTNPNSEYNRVTDAMVTSVSYQYANDNGGMSYVVTLEDGSFIVMDGGKRVTSMKDEEEMYNLLNALFQKIYGRAPSAQNPIRIAAWVLTHEHGDHVETFNAFCKKYGKDNTVRIERLLGNLASKSETYRAHGLTHGFSEGLSGLQDVVTGGIKYIKVHSGQKFYFANAEMEILYTHEDTYPLTIDYFNDTSTVFRITLKHTDDQSGEVLATNTSIWTGDMYKLGSRYISATYGDYLQSDMVQVAHHGYNGGEKEFYRYIMPTCVYVPVWERQWHTYQSANASPENWYYEVNYMISNQLSSVKHIFVADYTNRENGNYHITVKMTENGMDYANAFNGMTGNAIVTDGVVAIKK